MQLVSEGHWPKDSYVCPKCKEKTLIRERERGLCMSCYIPKIKSKRECLKCGESLHKENKTQYCINKNRCNAR